TLTPYQFARDRFGSGKLYVPLTNGCDQFWGMTGNSDVTRLGKGSRRYARNVLGTNAASMPLRKSQAPCFQTHTAFIYIASRDGQQTPKRVTFIGRSSQLPSDH